MSDVPPPAPQQPVAPAGWYPDPQSPLAQRWWDGSTWTEHTAPLGPVVVPKPAGKGSLYNGKQDVAAGKNTAAVQALVGGILTVLCAFIGGWFLLIAVLGGIADIVWGSIGIGRANLTGKGRGMAVTGLVLASVGIVLAVLRAL